MSECSVCHCSFFCRWTDLPNMPTGRWRASALCVQSEPEAILVVGGYRNGYFALQEARRCAELLTHTAGASGGGRGGDAWRWRQLNPMHDARKCRPGMLLLSSSGDRQRVLVAGGFTATAEILHLSCRDPNYRGQWTRIAPLSTEFYYTFLVEFDNRVYAISLFLDSSSHLLYSNNLILNLFGLLDSLGSVNELSSNAPGQLTVRQILRSGMPFSVCAFSLIYILFVFFSQMAPAESFAWRPLEKLQNHPLAVFVLRRE